VEDVPLLGLIDPVRLLDLFKFIFITLVVLGVGAFDELLNQGGILQVVDSVAPFQALMHHRFLLFSCLSIHDGVKPCIMVRLLEFRDNFATRRYLL
jgi:hypothetical protein